MKLRIVSEKYIKEEQIPRLQELLSELITETLKEDGCLQYTFNQDKEDKSHFAFIETWETESHSDAHGQTEHYKRILPEINSMCYKPGVLSKYYEFEG